MPEAELKYEILENDPVSTQPSEIQDFIGNPPGWILRSGISVIFFVVVIGLLLTWFIKYPDKIQAPVIITGEHPPVDMISKVSAKIDHIFVNNGDIVSEGEPLIYFTNTALVEDIEKVERFFYDYDQITNIPNYLELHFPENLLTGELNSRVGTFAQKFRQFRHLLLQSTVFQKLRSLDREIASTQKLMEIEQKEIEIYSTEYEIKEKDFERNSQLHAQGVIADVDLEKIETELLQKKRQLEQMKSGLIQNRIRVDQLRTQKIELAGQRQEKIQTNLNELEELITITRNEINAWRERYFILAPETGRVSLPERMIPPLFVKQGEVIGSIIPEIKTEEGGGSGLLAHAATPISGVGKMDVGSKVLIRLDPYPYKEFGTIHTKVEEISLLPLRDQEGKLTYELSMRLPDPLISSYGKELHYQPNMSGVALIITEDRTLFQRVFDQFYDLLKNK